ncbi:MAG: cytidylate kinase-like family protein [Acutalibacteraceae bacterium]
MGRHIVTVARQFGCGGGEIAKKLAELLSVEYFDKELLEKAAEASGISKDAFERADERAASSFLYSLAMSSYSGHISPVGVNDVMLSDKLFTVQSDAIRKLAAEKDCVIVEAALRPAFLLRGADAHSLSTPAGISAGGGDGAPSAQRVERAHLIRKTDKKAPPTTIYTSKDWGSSELHTLSMPPCSVWTKSPRC